MNGKGFVDGFKKFDYQNVDFQNMGSWPTGIKLVASIFVAGIITGAGFWFIIKDQYMTLEREVKTETQLKETYRQKAFQVANLDAYKLQLMDMEATFGTLLEQLPNETEISGLLDDINFTGVQSGLDFDSLALGQEVVSELFIETPIDIAARGGYHELGTFVSGLSALPRIVTLHDFTITRASSGTTSEADSRAPLLVQIKAKTYRYKPGGGQ